MTSDREQQRSDRILGFLVSRGLHGCPVCAKGEFGVGPEHVIIATPDQAGDASAEGAPVQGSAVVPVMCGNCGYTMLFGTRMLPNQGE